MRCKGRTIALDPVRKAICSNPIAPSHYYYHLGEVYTFTRRYEDAIAAFRKALERSPDYIPAHVNLTIAYSLSGRDDEARALAREILRVQPGFSVEKYTKTLPACLTKPTAVALRKAGLK